MAICVCPEGRYATNPAVKFAISIKRVYLDVRCLSRPFDDQEQERIHLESEAVRFILRHSYLCKVVWVGSSVLDLEMKRTPDIFLTIEDKLIKKSKMNMDKLQVRVENPVTWLQEVIA